MRRHYLICEAPVCRDYDTIHLLWYCDEPVCLQRPYTKWQKTQLKIQKLYKKGKVNPDRYFSAERLQRIRVVKEGIEGENPDKFLKG